MDQMLSEAKVTVTIQKSATPRTILVVEDNDDANKLLCELLIMLGHRVHGVLSAESALEAFADSRFDVLLTDVQLPGMSGIELASRLKRDEPALKVIFSSGYGAVSRNELEFRVASLPKPYDLKKLEDVLATLDNL